VIQETLRRTLDDGLNFGGHTALEGQLASLVCERFPSIDLVRFTNSGTEANLMALTAARAATKRERSSSSRAPITAAVLNFAGTDAINVPFKFVKAPYNDSPPPPTSSSVTRTASPPSSSSRCRAAPAASRPSSISSRGLRALASAHGIVLIFDEVMTSRLSPGGLQAATGSSPT